MKKFNHIILAWTILFNLCACKKETTLETVYVDGQNINSDGTNDTIINNNIEQYNSGPNSELVNSITVPTNPGWSPVTVIYSIKIPDLKKGDILSVTAKAEATNNYSNTFCISGELSLEASSTSHTSTIEITDWNGFNLLSYMQHGLITYLGTYECSSDLGDKYVNLLLTCEQVQGTAPPETLVINQGYGRLTVTVFRK